MNSKGVFIFFAIPILTVTFLLFINNAAFLGGVEQSRINEIKQQQDSQGSSDSAQNRPITEQEIIQLFFQSINQKNVQLALGILDPSIIKSEDDLKKYSDQFLAFSTVEVTSIEPYSEDTWVYDLHRYKVMIKAEMLPEASSAQIPNYGWENGDNIRWITLKKGDDTLWRVLEIATGP